MTSEDSLLPQMRNTKAQFQALTLKNFSTKQRLWHVPLTLFMCEGTLLKLLQLLWSVVCRLMCWWANQNHSLGCLIFFNLKKSMQPLSSKFWIRSPASLRMIGISYLLCNSARCFNDFLVWIIKGPNRLQAEKLKCYQQCHLLLTAVWRTSFKFKAVLMKFVAWYMTLVTSKLLKTWFPELNVYFVILMIPKPCAGPSRASKTLSKCLLVITQEFE